MTKEQMETKIAARKAVVEQVIAMLDNNVLADNGFEQFSGWCEDGEVFNDPIAWNCSTDTTYFGEELAAE